ncbi:pseudouridine synthase [Nonomuraea mesophila]|uniref:Pseudouridine synthase n=1 Tax=Nonomuraea mesophila TaxID=2530382 RepID=A0A4R5F283_9ACTN|nr:pseudouridine synthase [Nonomuraea mesophila]
MNRRSTPSGDGRGRGRTGGSGRGGRPAFRSDDARGDSRRDDDFRGGSGRTDGRGGSRRDDFRRDDSRRDDRDRDWGRDSVGGSRPSRDSLHADRGGTRARYGRPSGRDDAGGGRYPRGADRDRPSYSDRDGRDDRNSRGDRDDRYDRNSRGDRDDRDDRNSRGDRDDRYAPGDRGDRGRRGDRHERGGREDRYGRSERPRGDRGGYRSDRRDERAGGGYRSERRDERPGGYRSERRDERPGGYRPERGDARAGGYRSERGDRFERGNGSARGDRFERRDERPAGYRSERGGSERRDERAGGYRSERRDERGGYRSEPGGRSGRGGYGAERRDERGGFRADRSGRREAAPRNAESSRSRHGRRDGDARTGRDAGRTGRSSRRDDVQTVGGRRGGGSPQHDRVKAARQPLRDRDFYPEGYSDERDTTEVPDGVRLQKVLAQAGVASRRACEEMIGEGRVTVNGQVVRRFGAKVDPATQVIHVDGKRIPTAPDLVYYALNKPIGVVSTMDDPQGRPCLADYVEELAPRLFHVGRLDTETEGLLLLTNDGELANRLTHPSYGVQKKYWAKVPGPIPRDLGRRLKQGIELEDGIARADSFTVVQEHGQQALVEVVLHEGRKHVVRRMLEVAGHRVIDLARIEFGPVKLGRTKPGTMRALSLKEVGELYAAVKL